MIVLQQGGDEKHFIGALGIPYSNGYAEASCKLTNISHCEALIDEAVTLAHASAKKLASDKSKFALLKLQMRNHLGHFTELPELLVVARSKLDETMLEYLRRSVSFQRTISGSTGTLTLEQKEDVSGSLYLHVLPEQMRRNISGSLHDRRFEIEMTDRQREHIAWKITAAERAYEYCYGDVLKDYELENAHRSCSRFTESWADGMEKRVSLF